MAARSARARPARPVVLGYETITVPVMDEWILQWNGYVPGSRPADSPLNVSTAVDRHVDLRPVDRERVRHGVLVLDRDRGRRRRGEAIRMRTPGPGSSPRTGRRRSGRPRCPPCIRPRTSRRWPPVAPVRPAACRLRRCCTPRRRARSGRPPRRGSCAWSGLRSFRLGLVGRDEHSGGAECPRWRVGYDGPDVPGSPDPAQRPPARVVGRCRGAAAGRADGGRRCGRAGGARRIAREAIDQEVLEALGAGPGDPLHGPDDARGHRHRRQDRGDLLEGGASGPGRPVDPVGRGRLPVPAARAGRRGAAARAPACTWRAWPARSRRARSARLPPARDRARWWSWAPTRSTSS